jgi:site-specific recombinase XerD
MTERLAAAIRQQRHLRSRRVLCKDDGTPITRQGAWSRVRYAAKFAKVPTGVHILRHHADSRIMPSVCSTDWAFRETDSASSIVRSA